MIDTSNINPTLVKILKKCKSSVHFFIDNFCKVEHTTAGLIPFKLFSYQSKSLDAFLNHRFNIYKKNRQSGISTLTGAYCLWFAMFHTHKKILIVSKRDLDAKEFLRRNVKVVFDNLPNWMKDIYRAPDLVWNEHKVEFTTSSSITSLPSGDDTLRSNSASIVIIDEAAFMQHMGEMWAGGWSTLQGGGQVIVISTTKGIGNWYWATWTDAKAKINDFNPIEINWWDMDWRLELPNGTVIEPRKGIRPCATAEEIEKYGPYWSPWLEEQYKGLQEKGELGKFRQEVLAEFIGSGSTVLEQSVLSAIGDYQRDHQKKYKIQSEIVSYVDAIGDTYELDFNSNLWIWEMPKEGHRYAIGFDPSGGESRDYTAIVIWDVDAKEQVAEYNGKVRPKIATRMATWLGATYNWATIVLDRSGLGQTIAQELEQDIMYPSLWKSKKSITEKGRVGLNITSTSKEVVNKALKDNLGLDGFQVNSPKLYKQLMIYVNLGNGRTGHEPGAGNRDDLTIAAGLGIIGAQNDQFNNDQKLLIPLRTNSLSLSDPGEIDLDKYKNDAKVLMPISDSTTLNEGMDKRALLNNEIAKFSSQLVSGSRKHGESFEEWKKRITEIMRNKAEQSTQSNIKPNLRSPKSVKTIRLRKSK